jgi:GTP cyclohydrolase I
MIEVKQPKPSDLIKARIKEAGGRYWANDNVAEYLHEDEKEILINEAERAFEDVLDALLVDRENDPNSHGTARRLAKMYYNEIFSGRYEEMPPITSFPNEGTDKYEGMITIRAEIKSVCSHHHQPVQGVCYIGIIPNGGMLGLSKYIRLAQWHARRGTLQEELTVRITDSIIKETGSDHVAVYIHATHGCCENRGVGAHSSLTQTTVLRGWFMENPEVKREFMDKIKLQELHK